MTPLFRYFGSHAYETLSKQRLMTSRVSGFNDPFELLYSAKRTLTPAEAAAQIQNRLADPAFQAALKDARITAGPDQVQRMVTQPHVVEALISKHAENVEHGLKERLQNADDTLRLICFSSAQACPLDEILMWSHYANKHRGHRIGFKIPESPTNVYRIDPVDYSASRIQADYTGDFNDPVFREAMIKSINTKSLAWKYENEFRLTIKPWRCVSDTVNGKVGHFLPIEPDWVVRVDCGLHSDPSEDARIVAIVKKRYPRARVYKAQFHLTDYSTEYALIHPDA